MLAKKIGHASAITSLYTVFSLVLVLLIQSLIGKLYGPEGLGIYAAFMMFINIYSLLSILGLPSALSKYVAEFEEKKEFKKISTTVNSVLVFSLASSVFIGIVSLYLTPWLSRILHISSNYAICAVLAVSVIFYNIARIMQFYTQGLLRALRSSIIQIALYAGICAAIVYAYFYKPFPIHWALLCGCLLSAAAGIWLGLGLHKGGGMFSGKLFSEIVRFSIPIAAISHLYFISQWVDRFILGAMLGVAEIGIFTAAVTITQGVLQIPMSLSQVLLPSFSKINVYGSEKLEKAFNVTLKMMSLFLNFGAMAVFLLSRDIIVFLYKTRFGEFKDAVLILQILSLNILLSAFTIPASSAITGAGRPKYGALISFAGVMVQIILILMLTRRFGIVGTAFGRCVTLAVIVLMNIYVVVKIIKIKINWRSFIMPLLLCAACMGVFYLIENLAFNRAVSLSVSMASYAAVGWLFILLDEERGILIRAAKNLLGKTE